MSVRGAGGRYPARTRSSARALASASTRSRFMVMRSDRGEKAEATCFFSRGRNLRHGDGLEGFLHGFHQFDGFAASVGTDGCGASTARNSISLQPPPPGSRPDADFDKSGVQLGVWLSSRRVKRHLSAARREHRPKGRDHDRLGRKLDGLRHVLELADHEVDFVPLLFLHRHEQQHEVRADGEIAGIVGDDETRRSCRRGRRASASE